MLENLYTIGNYAYFTMHVNVEVQTNYTHIKADKDELYEQLLKYLSKHDTYKHYDLFKVEDIIESEIHHNSDDKTSRYMFTCVMRRTINRITK